MVGVGVVRRRAERRVVSGVAGMLSVALTAGLASVLPVQVSAAAAASSAASAVKPLAVVAAKPIVPPKAQPMVPAKGLKGGVWPGAASGTVDVAAVGGTPAG